MLEVCLFGQFTLCDATGEDITPGGNKAAALVALLAECDSKKRARRWLEQMLWSDRGEDQARGSLRQTLFELRRRLGPSSNVLQSDRTSVWLDPDLVVVQKMRPNRVFLEGLEVADPAFKDWLTRKRLAYGKRDTDGPATDRLVRIQCGTPWTAAHTDPIVARMVNDQVGGIISGFIAQSTRGVLDTDVDLVVRASLEEASEGAAIAVQVVDAQRDELVHSDYGVAPNMATFLGDRTALSRFCWQVADAALERLSEIRRPSDVVAQRAAWSQDAVRSVLSFDPEIMPRSLEILSDASDVLEDGLFYALRAWAMMSLIMEDRLEETRETLSSVKGALERALWLSPGDPMVAGIASNVQALLFENYSEAFRLSASALKSQPNNIFATQALSLCRFQLGAHDIAYQLSRRNREVAGPTKYGAMCDLHHALLCLRTDRPEEALVSSKAAADATPGYRAPNRQLVALYAAGGQIEQAGNQAALLGRIEPEFSISRLLDDERYPANTLRSTGILDKARREIEGGS